MATATRLALGALSLIGAAACGVIMVSDTVPVAAEAALGIGGPDAHEAAHVVIWFVLTVMVALSFWSWWGLFATAALLTAFGLAVEIAQGLWSTTRVVDVADLKADLVGTAAGLLVVALVMASAPGPRWDRESGEGAAVGAAGGDAGGR